MPLPKRRHSRSRRDKRRTHWKAAAPTVSKCSNCGEPKEPHRACPSCGYYRGRSVFLPREA
ncbi:MAG: 50S ribosomal protein L32 [candidate division KSB1 bacterium]|nr:50S ribosomal protein L32 [candidate division KSB1 bacterium]MDZ7338901.1 50S ribosomal protein L32 [candidate division KSB1 bacterium]MDZ7385874.1 50S ribosomal protein L32 [candidate division KSB1 bacterium]MDZ7393646.1 50S ribosomal protein L32 [candidate division KSB1 bacterium]MDZ7412737.1 50S ribosomal protein L32 [candidate division KSB1 bacterium]